MFQPKVSVIIPVYNADKYLRQCLDSVINQTMKDIEIICVDDGSTDMSVSILEEYSLNDKRVKCIHQKNQFAGAARNNGMSHANGEYFLFLDADDFFENDLVEKLWNQCQKENADIVLCGADLFDNHTKRHSEAGWLLKQDILKSRKAWTPTELGENIFNVVTPVPWNKLFSAAFINKYNLKFQNTRSANDLAFTFSAMVLAEKITWIPDVLVHYRVNIGTNTQAQKHKNPFDVCEALLCIKKNLEERDAFQFIKNYFVQMALNQCVWNLNTLNKIDSNASYILAKAIKEKYIYDLELLDKNNADISNSVQFDCLMKYLKSVESPIVSIIVAAYNVEKYIEECLESIVNQTRRNIEIIIVDDGSADATTGIIRKYEEKDTRIKAIYKKENEGLLAARRSGVEVATSPYIIFLDADDRLDVELCEFISEVTQREDADIIQFGVEINNYSGDQKKYNWLIHNLSPLEETLIDENIIRKAYIERKISTVLWGKIFKTYLCKKVYKLLPYEHCYVGEDIFTFYLLAYFAHDYKGINTKGHYIYNYGYGVGNADKMSLEKFELYCRMAKWSQYARDYLEQTEEKSIYFDACDAMAERMMTDCCSIYLNRINHEDKDNATKLIIRYWGKAFVRDKVCQKMFSCSFNSFANLTLKRYVKENSVFALSERIPKVSVIIPIYNVEKYIDECLNSVRNQTLSEIEIICVNDGSIDNSLELVEAHAMADDRITIISKYNGGQSSARNIGASYAKGKYIYFLDSDDNLLPNTLELLFNCSEENNLDILYFGAESFFENKQLERVHESYRDYYHRQVVTNQSVSGEELFDEMISKNAFRCSVPLQFINSSYLKNIGLRFKEGIAHEDELFSSILIVNAENVMCIDERLYRRRIRANSTITSHITHKKFVDLYIVAMTLFGYVMVTDKLSDSSKQSLLSYAKKMYNAAFCIFDELSDCEKRKIGSSMPEEYYFIFRKQGNNKMRQIELASAVNIEDESIKRYFLRKIRGGIQCCKDHGVIYTIRLALQKMKVKILR